MAEKKLTDICDIQYGYPFDSSGFSSSAEDGMPLIRIRDVKDGHSETYFKGDFPEEYIIHKGDYLVGMDGEFNIAAWQSDDALLNQRVCRIASKCHNVSTHYLYRFLTKELKRIEDETPFVTVKHLSAKRLNHVYLNVPSLPEQERIVAELDLLTGIIDKQKAQLQELDTLAQSIFYDMFGEVDINNKQWESVEVGDVFYSIKNGANIKQTKGAKGLPITRIETLSGGVFNRNRLGYADIFDAQKYSKYVLDDGDILMSHINSKAYIGRSVVYKKEDREIIIHGMNLLRLKPIPSILNSVYAKFLFDTFFFKKQVASIRKDAVNQSSIAVGDIIKLIMRLPPIEIQDTFAQKIQSIESQKASINRSITETQKLFDYTMDKYFG